ncbi:hypothetical protein [Paludifilum halophilum]|uniref:hypothetical protein n=1 Tax=Paludifilum halophilum TaxID=1642702 RepID=UPI0011402728|nr:hypothetical protein [Paludifilum halophilum]
MHKEEGGTIKPPKLYTSQNRSPRRSRRPSSSGKNKADVSISEGTENIRNISRRISSATSTMEQWVNAMTNLSHAAKDRKALNELISALSKVKLNNPPSKGSSSQPKSKSGGKTPSKPYSQDGDSLYDLINSPTFPEIIDKVMKNKKKKK